MSEEENTQTTNPAPEPAPEPAPGQLSPADAALASEFSPERWRTSLQRMFFYAASKPNIELDDSVVLAVTKLDEQGPITPELVHVYDVLSNAIRPATAESLEYAEGSSGRLGLQLRDFLPWHKKSEYATVLVGAVSWLLLAFLMTLFFQIHTEMGTALSKPMSSQVIKSIANGSAAPPPNNGNANANSDGVEDLIKAVDQSPTLLAKMNAWSCSPPSTIASLGHVRCGEDEGEDAGSAKVAIIRAHDVLEVMVVYVLPTLYGLFGACAYIARSLYEQIGTRSILPGQRFAFILRRLLGMTLGFASGMFIDFANEATGDIHMLTRAALAFLMGYSIEAMFAILDSLVSKIKDSFKIAPQQPEAPTKVSL